MTNHQTFTPVTGIRGWKFFACKHAQWCSIGSLFVDVNVCVKRFSHWVTRGRFVDVRVKFNIEPNGGIFEVSPKKRPCVTLCETTSPVSSLLGVETHHENLVKS